MGRIAGISGVIWGAVAGPDRSWRWVFLIGLLFGGGVTHFELGQPLPDPSRTPMWIVAISGLLVGIGTRMGGGCTSGHGGLRARSAFASISCRDPDVHGTRHYHGRCNANVERGCTVKAWPALIAGILFGLGLTLSGMSDPAKVLGFLNIAGDWVPDLIFVMGGAVVVTLIFTPSL